MVSHVLYLDILTNRIPDYEGESETSMVRPFILSKEYKTSFLGGDPFEQVSPARRLLYKSSSIEEIEEFLLSYRESVVRETCELHISRQAKFALGQLSKQHLEELVK
jgi:hypothetical protein